MNIIEDIMPFSNFRQQASEIIKKLGQVKRPTFITINGKVAAVVQDAESYQQILDKIDELETMLSIQRGLEDISAGRVSTLDEVSARLKARHEQV